MTTSSDRQPGKNVLRDSRAGRALRARHNWAQLLKFSTVGGSGFAVNLVVYWFALDYISLEYHLAATASFLIAAANNYLWNRLWTFRDQRGHLGYQGFRFLIVSGLAYGANLLFLTAFVAMGASKMIAQAVAIVLVTPINFLGNKLWSFRT